MPAVINSIKKRVAAFMRDPDLPAQTQYPDSENTGTGLADVEYATSGSDWGVTQDRKRMWDELDQMDRTDEIVSSGLDVIAACATGYEPTQEDSFTWRFEQASPDQGAIDILQRLKEQLDLGTQSNQIVRSFVKGGAEYRELVVNDKLEVVRFKHLPSYQIWPTLDEFGNKVPGYEQRKGGTRPGSGIQLEEWQIVPFLYNSEDGVFGKGLMESARGTYGRLRTVEDGMVAARIIRAYDRLKHKVPVPMGSNEVKQKQIIDAYKLNFTVERVPGASGSGSLRTRRKPMGVATDIYIPEDGSNKGDVTSIVAHNAQLKDIDDVQYLRERLLIAIRVPRTYLNLGTGNEGAITDSGSATEDIQFARTLRQIQAVLRRGLKELATIALFFQGYDTDALGVRVDMPRVNTENFLQASEVQLNMAKSAVLLNTVLGKLPPEIVAKEFMMLSDDDRETLVSLIKSRPEEDGQDQSAGPTLDDLAHAIARLKVRTNAALGSKRAAIGESEAFMIAQSAILDALAA